MRGLALALLLCAPAACAASAPPAPRARPTVTVEAPTRTAAPEGAGAIADGGDRARASVAAAKLAARVDVQAPTTTGLTDAAKTIAAIRPALGRCFQVALERDDALAGKIVLRAKVDAAGKITAVKMEDELGLDVDLASCLVNAVREATFPAPAGGSGTLVLPLQVTPK